MGKYNNPALRNRAVGTGFAGRRQDIGRNHLGINHTLLHKWLQHAKEFSLHALLLGKFRPFLHLQACYPKSCGNEGEQMIQKC